MARSVEDADFDEVWIGDHVALNRDMHSTYPYLSKGVAFFPPDADWYESTVTASAILAATTRVGVGIGTMVAALRPPVLLAKQLATIDRLSSGRIQLAVGVGWLAEEYAALGIPWDERGKRLDGLIDVLRDCWTGSPAGGNYGPYHLEEGVRTFPIPSSSLRILGGGNSKAAIRRAVERCDGWYGAAHVDAESLEMLRAVVSQIQSARPTSERSEQPFDYSLNLAVSARQLQEKGSAYLAGYLEQAITIGIERIVFGFGWASLDQGRDTMGLIREAVNSVTREEQP
ncbi:hypothetical protein ASE01_17130 [Nocardioides sp. Root190]|nr:hypothetical protein ASE01_17130 [Nocardioides sp. Root190]